MFSMIISTAYIKLKAIGWSVGPSVRLSIGPSQLNVFLYNSYTMSWTETKIGVRVVINDSKHFLEGQGNSVKSQGQIRDFVEVLFGL